MRRKPSFFFFFFFLNDASRHASGEVKVPTAKAREKVGPHPKRAVSSHLSFDLRLA